MKIFLLTTLLFSSLLAIDLDALQKEKRAYKSKVMKQTNKKEKNSKIRIIFHTPIDVATFAKKFQLKVDTCILDKICTFTPLKETDIDALILTIKTSSTQMLSIKRDRQYHFRVY